jgi:hypothetical protein
MKLRRYFFSFAIWFVLASPLVAQDLPELQMQLDKSREDLGALRRVVNSLDRVDSTFEAYFPVWRVLDQTLRLKVFAAFRKRNISYNDRDDVYVIATPDTQEIVDVHIGDGKYGRLLTRNILDRTLKAELLRVHDYPIAEEIPPGYYRANSNRKSSARPLTPNWVSANISLFGGEVRFGNDWALVGKVGDDVLGYPFWSSGQAWLMLRYKSIAIGTRLPVHGGLDDFALGLRTRRLNGSTGLAAEFEIEWDLLKIGSDNFTYGGLGGSFSIGRLSNRRPDLLTDDLQKLYSISHIAELHYTFDLQFDHALQLMIVQAGIGYHRVSVSKMENVDIVKADEARSFALPIITVAYKHQRADWFTVRGQLSRLATISAWAELVPGYVFAEVKYSSVIFRDPRPWEHPSYFYGTLGLRFDF